MKHRLGVSVGVVLLGIGVAPFWTGKSPGTTHTASETAAANSSGKRAILVASTTDDYIPPLLGYTDDDLIDNPRINPMLALTGADADEEPGRLAFAAEYLQRLPVAPGLLLMGGYDAPRLTPFPNPGASAGLNLFGGNQFDPAGTSPDNSNRVANGPGVGYPPAAPASINPAAPLTFPRPSPGLAQPMPNPQGPGQGGFGPPPQGVYGPPQGQNPGAYTNASPPGMGAPPAGCGAPAPGYGAPAPYPMGQPEMLAYAGPDLGNPAAAPFQARPAAGYPQATPPYAAQGYPPANYGPQGAYGYGAPAGYGYGAQAGFGYGADCGCQNIRGFGGGISPYFGANYGGYPQFSGVLAGGQAGYGYGGFHNGMTPTSFNSGFGEGVGYGGYGGYGFGCCQSSIGCCSMPASCCGSEMGSFAMGGMNCCGRIESYGGCCSSGCGSQKCGLFGRLKDWFKGGSRCDNNYDGCCEQKSCGLFSRIKNLFRKKKDGCCYSTPIYGGGDCCNTFGGGAFDGGYAGGYSGGFGY
jgi:hypothetical protein